MSNYELENFQIGGHTLKVADQTAREMIQTLQNSIYPVGSVIVSTTCPSESDVISAYGGIHWIRHSGYMLRGASVGVTANDNTKTGGSDDAVLVQHTHTFAGNQVTTGNNSVGHTHSIPALSGTASSGGNWSFENRALLNRVGSTYNVSTPTNVTISNSATTNYKIANNSDTTDAGTVQTKVTHSGHTHGVTTVANKTGGISTNHTHNVTATGTNSTEGTSGTNKNVPNYKSVYMWERIE